jgi:TonB family protein
MIAARRGLGKPKPSSLLYGTWQSSPVSTRVETMRRQTTLAISVLAAAVVGAATLRTLAPRKLALTPSDLMLGELPQPPPQPTMATFECSRGLAGTLTDISGDWVLIQDHPPCTLAGDFLLPVKATAAEMVALNRRPQISFQVAANGRVRNASVSRTSGSKTLDDRLLKEVTAHRYKGNNCGVCRVTTVVDVDFQGPVWMREAAR